MRKTMTVQELINKLSEVEDKTQRVFFPTEDDFLLNVESVRKSYGEIAGKPEEEIDIVIVSNEYPSL